MSKRPDPKTVLAALLVVVTLLLALSEPVLSHRDRGQGSLSVYNCTDRRLTVYVDGCNQGYVEKGSYQTYYVRMGSHMVEGTWDTGSAKKYCNLDPYWGYDTCYFYQRDIY